MKTGRQEIGALREFTTMAEVKKMSSKEQPGWLREQQKDLVNFLSRLEIVEKDVITSYENVGEWPTWVETWQTEIDRSRIAVIFCLSI